jgi:multidrug resistance efflux pump
MPTVEPDVRTSLPPSPMAEGEALRTLQTRCLAAVSSSRSRDELLKALSQVAAETIKPEVVVRVSPSATSEFDGDVHELLLPPSGFAPELRRPLVVIGLAAISTRTTRLRRPSETAPYVTIATPIPGDSRDALVAVFAKTPSSVDVLITVMEFLSSYVPLWGRSNEESGETECSAAVVDLVQRALSAPNAGAAAETIVRQLHSFFGTAAVGIGTCGRAGQSCRVVASCTTDGQADASPDRKTLWAAAFDECVLRGEMTIWPSDRDGQRHALLAQQQLGQTLSAACVASCPLRLAGGTTVGVWTVATTDLVDQPRILAFLRAASPAIAQAVNAMQEAEPGRLRRWTTSIRQMSANGKTWCWLAGVAILAAMMFWPRAYVVQCECEIQPVRVRYIPAPFEARLDECLVEPGDVVAKGDLLARLDGTEIRWKLSGITAEWDRSSKERDGHLALKEINAAQVSRLQMERLQQETELLQDRTTRLEIRSPIDGVVISGDLKKNEGAPLSIGQTLFEIAPLEQMVVEFGIPEDDVLHVDLKMPVEFVVDSLPERSWTGTVEKVHPRGEVKDQSHVFVAELSLPNDNGLLRPGMRGRAWITTKKQPWGWNLFHKAWYRLRSSLGW